MPELPLGNHSGRSGPTGHAGSHLSPDVYEIFQKVFDRVGEHSVNATVFESRRITRELFEVRNPVHGLLLLFSEQAAVLSYFTEVLIEYRHIMGSLRPPRRYSWPVGESWSIDAFRIG